MTTTKSNTYRFYLVIYNDDDFSLYGPGIEYHPFSGELHHVIEAETLEELKLRASYFMLQLTCVEPWAAPDSYDWVYDPMDFSHHLTFRSTLYEAAKAIGYRVYFYSGGNRHIAWEILTPGVEAPHWKDIGDC